MEYIIATTVSTDEVHLADGTVFPNQPGSAGFYALAGMRVYTDKILICGGIGPEYLPRHEKWYKDNHVSTEGLILRSEVSPTIVIHYFPDGSRTDEPNVGLHVFRALDPTPEEVFRCCGRETKGVYTFKGLDRPNLEALIAGREKYGYKLMWEIGEDACVPENIPVIEQYLKSVDVFSINRGEAKMLYGVDTEEEAQDRLCTAAPHWVYFRRGSQGGNILAGGEVYSCGSVKDVQVVDSTGGGNSSSAAVLYACCEGYDPKMAAAMGSAAAAVIISQFGVPEIMDENTTEQALKAARSLVE